MDGRYIWDPDIRVVQDGERGWSLQFRNKGPIQASSAQRKAVKKGYDVSKDIKDVIFIPFGGVKISRTRAQSIMNYLAVLYLRLTSATDITSCASRQVPPAVVSARSKADHIHER